MPEMDSTAALLSAAKDARGYLVSLNGYLYAHSMVGDDYERTVAALDRAIAASDPLPTADLIRRLARNFAAEWLRPSDPDSAEPSLLDTLSTMMAAFYAATSSAIERRTPRITPETAAASVASPAAAPATVGAHTPDAINADLFAALRRLSAEVSGLLGTIEEEMREAAGNTNVNVLVDRWHEGKAALAQAKGGTR